MYMVSKHRGFIMVTYFDLRAAARAQAALHGAPITSLPLDIHFCAPKGDPTVSQVRLARSAHRIALHNTPALVLHSARLRIHPGVSSNTCMRPTYVFRFPTAGHRVPVQPGPRHLE